MDILTALMGYIVWLLKNQKKDRDANSKGTMLLLKVQLIEYHDRYMTDGDIPSYAYQNFCEMYDASGTISTDAPKTGDDTPVMFWILLAGLGIIGFGTSAVYLRKKRKK